MSERVVTIEGANKVGDIDVSLPARCLLNLSPYGQLSQVVIPTPTAYSGLLFFLYLYSHITRSLNLHLPHPPLYTPVTTNNYLKRPKFLVTRIVAHTVHTNNNSIIGNTDLSKYINFIQILMQSHM